MHDVHLSASIICGSLIALGTELDALERATVDSIHIDIMDGHFVPNLSFGPDMVKAIRAATSLPLHVHLMMTDPTWILPSLAEAGCDVCYFHLEAERYPYRMIDRILNLGMTPGIALNPATPVETVEAVNPPYLLVMTVEPGFAGQRWLPQSIERVRRAHGLFGKGTVIGVDGNVSLKNAELSAAAGASLFVCGTSVLFVKNRGYVETVSSLRDVIAGARESLVSHEAERETGGVIHGKGTTRG